MTPVQVKEQKVNNVEYQVGRSPLFPPDLIVNKMTFYSKAPELPVKPKKAERAIYVYRLTQLKSDQYVLRRVLFVQVEDTEDKQRFIAKVPSLEIFGLGNTEQEAIRDFQFCLMEDYAILKEEEKLSDHLQEHLKYLNTIIREIPCH